MDSAFARSFLKPKVNGNYIQNLNPLSKGNILFVLGASAFLVNQYWYGFLLSALYLVIAAAAGKFKPFFSIFAKVAVLFTVFLFLVRACFTDGSEILFQLWGIHVTPEGIILGLNSASLVLAFSGAFILFMTLTPMHQLMYALEQKGMSHIVSYITLSSFQTIADLGENAKTIMESQKARGIETEGNMFNRLKAYIPVLGPLVLNAISSAEEKTIAMDARAFSAPVPHTFLADLPPIMHTEKYLVLCFNAALVLLILWRFSIWMISY